MDEKQNAMSNTANWQQASENTDVSDEMDGRYLTFWSENQLFGIPIAEVIQIAGIQKITPVPQFPAYAKGIINLRGNIIPVIDIRLRFHKPEQEYNERTCIVITAIQNKYAGFIVDAVDSVIKIEEENISPPPDISSDLINGYLMGVAKAENKVILLLNSGKVIYQDTGKTLSKI